MTNTQYWLLVVRLVVLVAIRLTGYVLVAMLLGDLLRQGVGYVIRWDGWPSFWETASPVLQIVLPFGVLAYLWSLMIQLTRRGRV